jgi:hypothetical protein
MLLHVAPPDTSYAAAGGSVLGDLSLVAIGALVCLVLAYLVYKVMLTGRMDYGMPVRRRLLCKRLRVDHDQSAQIPFWWTELQAQRAVRAHWRRTLRLPLEPAADTSPQSLALQ